jgi:hypothetical protein
MGEKAPFSPLTFTRTGQNRVKPDGNWGACDVFWDLRSSRRHGQADSLPQWHQPHATAVLAAPLAGLAAQLPSHCHSSKRATHDVRT